MKTANAFFLLFVLCITSLAQGPAPDRQQFIRVDATVIALTHVRVIDGTGAAPLEDQTIVIADGKIQSIAPTASAKVQPGAQILDLKGYSALPGLIGMHDHMFFPMGGSPPMYSDMGTSFPRLYLALGVTTIRTTGSVEVSATFFAISVRIVSFTAVLLRSNCRRLAETAAPGHLSGCLFATNSESGSRPCSRLSMPISAASR